ncbi:uncharacterized protein MEPE_05492 [Melanopsichium pennsylvanicum]|uniref:Uncharacterized protein n=1 Tax=Melanopsichium pennsylvanicum TaxID=63383 RepID=A0AAJ4XTD7_9BASI|nr:uncharacterized protein MEPE_05492 [Melanopsichium pennsylvanicum]
MRVLMVDLAQHESSESNNKFRESGVHARVTLRNPRSARRAPPPRRELANQPIANPFDIASA